MAQRGAVILPQVTDIITISPESLEFTILSSLFFFPKRETFRVCAHFSPLFGSCLKGSLAERVTDQFPAWLGCLGMLQAPRR